MASIAPQPTYITLQPLKGEHPTILQYLCERFPRVGIKVWEKRLNSGKITTDKDEIVTSDFPYKPHLRLKYYREVEFEPKIPFEEKIIFYNRDLLIVDKPHFLPTIPKGVYINESLVYRVRKKTGNNDLVPVNRLDKETAGLVVFSANKETRKLYHGLFFHRKIKKTYIAKGIKPQSKCLSWHIKNRIVQGEPWFRRKIEEGPPNSESYIKLIKEENDVALFELNPITGKTHQLRLHMVSIGSYIINDSLYPILKPEKKGFNNPLQLVARKIRFKDPVMGKEVEFTSGFSL